MSELVVSTSKPLHERVNITNEMIANLVQESLGVSGVTAIESMPYGYNNKIAAVTYDGGQKKVVIKISVVEDKFKKLEIEADILKRFGKDSNVPVPEVLHEDFSLEKFEFPFVIYSLLPGKNLVDVINDVSNKGSIGKELARIVEAFQAIHYEKPSFSLTDSMVSNSWREVLEKKMEEFMPLFKESNTPSKEKALDLFYKGMQDLVEPSYYSLVHRDLQPQNMNWDIETNSLSGVFDFETAMAGDPLYEFCLLERNLFRLYPEIRNAFYEEYKKLNELPDNYQETVRFYLLYQLMYFYQRCVKKGEDDRQQKMLDEIERLVN